MRAGKVSKFRDKRICSLLSLISVRVEEHRLSLCADNKHHTEWTIAVGDGVQAMIVIVGCSSLFSCGRVLICI